MMAFPAVADRARVVSDCRMANDVATMSSTIPARCKLGLAFRKIGVAGLALPCQINGHEHSHTTGNTSPAGLRGEPRRDGRRSGKVSASGRIGGAILNG